MKYYFYNDYLTSTTKGLAYVTNLGDFSLYMNGIVARLIYHENIIGWQDGRFKERHLSRDDFKSLLHDANKFDLTDDADERELYKNWIEDMF